MMSNFHIILWFFISGGIGTALGLIVRYVMFPSVTLLFVDCMRLAMVVGIVLVSFLFLRSAATAGHVSGFINLVTYIWIMAYTIGAAVGYAIDVPFLRHRPVGIKSKLTVDEEGHLFCVEPFGDELS